MENLLTEDALGYKEEEKGKGWASSKSCMPQSAPPVMESEGHPEFTHYGSGSSPDLHPVPDEKLRETQEFNYPFRNVRETEHSDLAQLSL